MVIEARFDWDQRTIDQYTHYYTHFTSPVFDNLYHDCSSESNDSVRGLKYMQMDQLLIEDAPVVVLYYDEALRFSRKNISGLGSNPLNMLILKQVKKTYEKLQLSKN